jgi:hypothetical protein
VGFVKIGRIVGEKSPLHLSTLKKANKRRKLVLAPDFINCRMVKRGPSPDPNRTKVPCDEKIICYLGWRYGGIETLAKIITNVYKASDSIRARPRINASWIPGRAEGLRASASAAAAVALACPIPQTADAIAIEKPAVITTQIAMRVDSAVVAPPPWANAGMVARTKPNVTRKYLNVLRMLFLRKLPSDGVRCGERLFNAVPSGATRLDHRLTAIKQDLKSASGFKNKRLWDVPAFEG